MLCDPLHHDAQSPRPTSAQVAGQDVQIFSFWNFFLHFFFIFPLLPFATHFAQVFFGLPLYWKFGSSAQPVEVQVVDEVPLEVGKRVGLGVGLGVGLAVGLAVGTPVGTPVGT
eukprot:CAMPEP_0172386654 /NCGR_PEP_ID=MMETSP1061-20121228/4129_1 /TAXON_ID=37318 /ORGANISM="Pseudo-nitzschia pungens, Strain cf. pungens" /LENGTH=112 /DNA_ID=CAMNT_0013116065 /DNA_START=179 /DNA_END=514 /DNA_ORIENTATION=+